jgi:hypothetical protein
MVALTLSPPLVLDYRSVEGPTRQSFFGPMPMLAQTAILAIAGKNKGRTPQYNEGAEEMLRTKSERGIANG